ncbi:unnamed protein product [Spirodela intermedia]|uniref:Uncharacterized protein n=1 Tax=Spirodela intermedia TaxID=51605 RepID=A0A7I8J8M1_SPIIN|nr:unnamed protein product [Spirodela intermedia]CAA6666105.1 unnamed protein product [Spirodela intermedia]
MKPAGAEGKGKREATTAPFEFCKVCNLNHNQGRRHRYFPNHVKALSRFLSRFQDKLSELRFFLKNPSPLRPTPSSGKAVRPYLLQRKFLCHPYHLSSCFSCSCNAIYHLASSEHLKKLKNFLWKYGGGMDRVSSFIISEVDLLKWEKKCEASKIAHPILCDVSIGGPMSSKDIHNDFSCKNKNTSVDNSVLSFEQTISPGVPPLQSDTIDVKTRLLVNDAEVPACSSSNSVLVSLNKGEVLEVNALLVFIDTSLISFTFYFFSTSEGHEAYVGRDMHPPWLEDNENVDLIPGDKKVLSLNTSVKGGASRKLNPKRVGAAWAEKRRVELEMEKSGQMVASDYDDNWLPNFGRVWQDGTRKDSRKEFEREKYQSCDADLEVSIKLQPYISKRMMVTSDVFSGTLRCLLRGEAEIGCLR